MIEPYVSIGINLKQINDAVLSENELQVKSDIKQFCERCNGSNCNRHSTCILLREDGPLALIDKFCSQAICSSPQFCKKSCPLYSHRSKNKVRKTTIFKACNTCQKRLILGKNWTEYLKSEKRNICVSCYNEKQNRSLV